MHLFGRMLITTMVFVMTGIIGGWSNTCCRTRFELGWLSGLKIIRI